MLRVEGKVTFVPFVAEGETIRARIVDDRGSYAFGALEEILVPGPSRTDPFCPAFAECGGCHLQHVSYEAQC